MSLLDLEVVKSVADFHIYISKKNNEMIYNEKTHKIIGCAMKVHTTLGNGFQELIYQRALVIENGKAASAI